MSRCNDLPAASVRSNKNPSVHVRPGLAIFLVQMTTRLLRPASRNPRRLDNKSTPKRAYIQPQAAQARRAQSCRRGCSQPPQQKPSGPFRCRRSQLPLMPSQSCLRSCARLGPPPSAGRSFWFAPKRLGRAGRAGRRGEGAMRRRWRRGGEEPFRVLYAPFRYVRRILVLYRARTHLHARTNFVSDVGESESLFHSIIYLATVLYR